MYGVSSQVRAGRQGSDFFMTADPSVKVWEQSHNLLLKLHLYTHDYYPSFSISSVETYCLILYSMSYFISSLEFEALEIHGRGQDIKEILIDHQ